MTTEDQAHEEHASEDKTEAEAGRVKYPFAPWQSLSFKMTAATALVLSISLGATFLYALMIETDLEFYQVDRYTRTVAELVIQSFDSIATEKTPYHTKYLAAKLLDLPQLHNLRVIAPDGTIQFSRDTFEIGSPLDLPYRDTCNQCHTGSRATSDSLTFISPQGRAVYHLSFPVPNMDRCLRCHRSEFKILGTLIVETEVESIVEKLSIHRNSLIISILLSILFSLLGTTMLFRRFVKNPLDRLQEDMRKVEGGDFQVGPCPESRDELREAYESFLSMTHSLEEVRNHQDEMLAAKSAKLDDLSQEVRRIYSNLIRLEHLSAIGTLSAQVVHEVRTPLNALSLNLQLLNRELTKHGDLDVEAKELAANIGKEVERISVVLDKFHDRARRPQSPPTRESVRELVSGVVALMDLEAKKGGVNIKIEIPPEPQTLLLHADEIRQILINLVSNAIHAVPKGGTIRLAAEKKPDGYEIRVADDGVGIPPENIGKIFAPFFTTRESGTGLGLAIVKRLAEEMGGSIRVESKPGSGATFFILLPQDG